LPLEVASSPAAADLKLGLTFHVLAAWSTALRQRLRGA
jgi:hypothetical protein